MLNLHVAFCFSQDQKVLYTPLTLTCWEVDKDDHLLKMYMSCWCMTTTYPGSKLVNIHHCCLLGFPFR